MFVIVGLIFNFKNVKNKCKFYKLNKNFKLRKMKVVPLIGSGLGGWLHAKCVGNQIKYEINKRILFTLMISDGSFFLSLKF